MNMQGEQALESLEKSWQRQLGVNSRERKSVFFVGRDANPKFTEEENFAKFFQTPLNFLLPYCAKSPTCKYRYVEGCERCGGCDIGEAYQLAEEYGMKPVTIQNYEMLENELLKLKGQGVSAFIGTCCQTFLNKHRQDFERIGLPGVLVDIDNSTCYHQGKEKEAHQGTFQNQTRLRLDLLRRVINTLISA